MMVKAANRPLDELRSAVQIGRRGTGNKLHRELRGVQDPGELVDDRPRECVLVVDRKLNVPESVQLGTLAENID